MWICLLTHFYLVFTFLVYFGNSLHETCTACNCVVKLMLRYLCPKICSSLKSHKFIFNASSNSVFSRFYALFGICEGLRSESGLCGARQRVAPRMSDFPSVSLGAVLAGVQLLAVGFTRHTSGCTNSSWTSIESSTYICSSPCSEAQLISSACSTQKSHRCYSNCSSAAPSLHKSLLVES